MHPIVTPFTRPCDVIEDALERYRRLLAPMDYDNRNAAVVGVLQAQVEAIFHAQDASKAKAYLRDAAAALVARFQLEEEEIGRYFYDRDAFAEPNEALPAGVEGWHVGGRVR